MRKHLIVFLASSSLWFALTGGSAQAKVRLAPLPPLHRSAPKADAQSPAAMAPSLVTGSGQTALYSGQTDAAQAGLTLSSWGGGSVEDSTKLTIGGSNSLSVTTVDSYQGGLITFSTPVPLGNMTDPTRYLQMAVRFPRAEGKPGGPFGGGRFGGGRFGGGRFGGGRFGRGRFGRGGPGGPASQAPPYNPNGPPVITTLRWVFTLSDGQQAEVLRPLPEEAVDGDGSVDIAVPLSVLKFDDASNGAAPAATGQDSLQSIMVAANGYATFSIGSISIITDNTPITAIAGHDQYTGTGREVVFTGQADAGASSLLYAWDFDTKGAFADQAEGQTVSTHYFMGGKDYTVTLRVSDIDGIKPPATSTLIVHVH